MNKKIFLATPFAFLSLIMGIVGGLSRAGWGFDVDSATLSHGGIMVGCFLGTVITLERAAVLKRLSFYLIPFSAGVSIIFFLAGYPAISFVLLTLAASGLIIMYIILFLRFREWYIFMMLLGAVSWLSGNISMILSPAYPLAAGWWILFIMLTIVGERLELSKFLPDREYKKVTIWILVALMLVIVILDLDHIFYGILFTLTGLWLIRYDVAIKSAKKDGLNGYVGILLLAGYGWLIITGILQIVPTSGFIYDAVLHSFFVGFAFTMIFAHGPLIFPGVAGLVVKPYHPVLYAWFGLLQLSLVARIFADVLAKPELRSLSSLGNGIAILGFFITLIILTRIKLKNPSFGKS